MFLSLYSAADTRAGLEKACVDALKSDPVRRAIGNTGMSFKYLTGAQFQAQTVADYKFKGELIKRLKQSRKVAA